MLILSRLYTRATYCPDEQHVAVNTYVDGNLLPGYKLLVWATCWLYLGNIIILLFIYVTVDLYPFVSSNRRATRATILLPIYKQHVDGNRTHVAGQHVALV